MSSSTSHPKILISTTSKNMRSRMIELNTYTHHFIKINPSYSHSEAFDLLYDIFFENVIYKEDLEDDEEIDLNLD